MTNVTNPFLVLVWAVLIGIRMPFSLFSPDDNDNNLNKGGNDEDYCNEDEYDDFADEEPCARKALKRKDKIPMIYFLL